MSETDEDAKLYRRMSFMITRPQDTEFLAFRLAISHGRPLSEAEAARQLFDWALKNHPRPRRQD